ncbi:hypothetical protein LINPERPRIM_LOCUS35783 [Linum perenne]
MSMFRRDNSTPKSSFIMLELGQFCEVGGGTFISSDELDLHIREEEVRILDEAGTDSCRHERDEQRRRREEDSGAAEGAVGVRSKPDVDAIHVERVRAVRQRGQLAAVVRCVGGRREVVGVEEDEGFGCFCKG